MRPHCIACPLEGADRLVEVRLRPRRLLKDPVEREVLDCHDLSHVVLLMLVLNQSVEYYPV